MGRPAAPGLQGTINRARPNDRIYRDAEGGVGVLNVRDVRVVSVRARYLCVAERPGAVAGDLRLCGQLVSR